ncbi:hypothetical protein FSP39_023425 [Pinctada imbricata]|uniref:PDZ domain-containing protein n=1 Tax=Pinctada imbricata TaxID=66713 RepID=A0AA88XX15_PINIB|nr:hypothetical protein FSP39_023425 [Pinctada imbricata]
MSPFQKRIVTRMHLLKDEYGLGIHIAGGKGSRKGDIGIFVAGVTESGAAFRDGRLKRGDELLMINGKSLIGLTHGEAVEVLRNSPKLVQLVVAAKMRKSSSIASTNSYSVPSLLTDCHSNKPADDTITVPKVTAQTPHGTVFNLDELIERFDHSLAGSKQADRSDSLPKFENCQTLIINKGAKGKGLGFTIVGGSDSEKGNLGIYVRRIFPRGLVAEEGAMKEGDEIIQLNGQQMRGLTHSEALAKFRQLKKGPVTIVFCRKTRSRASSPSVRLAKTSSADFSSEGSPVSTPGHSPYGSCSDLTTLDDQEDPINTINCISTSSSYDNFLDINQTVSPVQFESSESAILDVSASAGERPKLSQKEESDYEITLEKELGIGLGISLIRKDTAGISHIYIQDIYHGSPADKDGRLHIDTIWDRRIDGNEGTNSMSPPVGDEGMHDKGTEKGVLGLLGWKRPKRRPKRPRSLVLKMAEPNNTQSQEYQRPTDGISLEDKGKSKTQRPVAAPRASLQKMESDGVTDSDLSDWESRQFGRTTLMSPPLVKSGTDKQPPSSPAKRSYPTMFNSGLDSMEFNQELYPKRKPNFPWDPEKENKYSSNWNNSVSSRDSAISGSLFSTFGSALTESSSSFESASNTDETASNISSPSRILYGTYNKISGDGKGSESESGDSDTEVLVLHRLPGENIGMILGIDKSDDNKRVSKVFVKTVTIGGAAHRATGGTRGVQIGDEILQINGTDINTLTHDECISVLREMPLRVILKIKRSKLRPVQGSPTASVKSLSSYQNGHSSSQYSESSVYSESEDENIAPDKIEGFKLHRAEIDKDPEESLGLSIVPSYGSTRQYYQIKRLLPSGAASRSGQLKVGDRLISCNGHSLRSVSQQQCLSILKTEANNGDLEIEVLRQTEAHDQCLEISVQVPNRAGIAGGYNSTLTLRSPNFERKEIPFSDFAETDSDNEVVLNKYNFLNDQTRFDKQSQDINGKGIVGGTSPDHEHNHESRLGLDSSTSSGEFIDTEKMDQKEEAGNWEFVPPPAEFSRFGPAVPPPAEFSEGQSPIFNQSASKDIPVTNIDDILTSYPEAPSEFQESTNSRDADSSLVDTNNSIDIDIVADIVGLEESVQTSRSPLPQINETSTEVNGDYELQASCHNRSEQNALSKREDRNSDQDNKDININETMKRHHQEETKVVLNNEIETESDSDLIVPVSVPRKKLEVVLSTIPSSSSKAKDKPQNVEEDLIVPDFKKRENSAPVSKSDDKRVSTEIVISDRPVSPEVVSRPRQMQPSKISHPAPPPKVDNSDHVSEEVVMPVKVNREESSNILHIKLGRDIEEPLVKSEVKRESSWNPAKMVMLTNAWSKSASQNKEQNRTEVSDKTDNENSKSFKSVIGVVNSLKDKKIEPSSETPKVDGTEENDTKNVTEKCEEDVSPKEDISTTVHREPDVKETKSAISTITVERSQIKVNSQSESKTEASDAQKDVLKDEKGPELATKSSEIIQKQTPNSTSSSAQYKTTVSIAKPHSLLGTIRSQNASSQMKPLSTIKPLTVSAKSFSLSKSSKFSSTGSTGKTSLLSTIHGTSLSSQNKNSRSEEEPFLINILKGILGIGMKVVTTADGAVQVTEIQKNGPICKDGNVRVGDYILAINNTELTGLPDSKVQQIIRLLPRGIAKILVSVKPPTECKYLSFASEKRLSARNDGILTINTSTSTLSSPSSSSPRSLQENDTSPRSNKLSPAMSPRQPTKSPLTSPVLGITSTKMESKVTLKHDQATEKPRSTENSSAISKVPPSVLSKPKGTVESASSKYVHSKGGYVSSALGRKQPFENKPSAVVDKPVIHQRKADYVSSASKVDKTDQDNKGPIDTVIFASINSQQKSDFVSSARKSLGEVSSYDKKKEEPEPKLIPKGQIDYVSSSQAKKTPPPVLPRSKDTQATPKPNDIEISPYAYEEPPTTKIQPVKLNSALSPRGKRNDGAFSFGTKFGKSPDKQGKSPVSSPLSSPRSLGDPSPSVSPRSPKSTEISHSKWHGTPPPVSPKPSPSPRNISKALEPTEQNVHAEPTHEKHEGQTQDHTSDTPTQEAIVVAISNETSESSPHEEITEVSTSELSVQSTACEVPLAPVHEAEGKTESCIDVSHKVTNILDDTNISVPSQSTDALLIPSTTQHAPSPNEQSTNDNEQYSVDNKLDSKELALNNVDDSEQTLKEFALKIVNNAIQNGLEEVKREEAELKHDTVNDLDFVHLDIAGKSDSQLDVLVAGSGHEVKSPTHIMDASPLRAFLHKMSDANESSSSQDMSQNDAVNTPPPALPTNAPPEISPSGLNAVAGNLANEMVKESELEIEPQNLPQLQSFVHQSGALDTNNVNSNDSRLDGDTSGTNSCMSDVLPASTLACSIVTESIQPLDSFKHVEHLNSENTETIDTNEYPSPQEEVQDDKGSRKNESGNIESENNNLSVEGLKSNDVMSEIQNSFSEIENKINAVETVLKSNPDLASEDISNSSDPSENISNCDKPFVAEELAMDEEISFPNSNIDEIEDINVPDTTSVNGVVENSETSDYSGITSLRKWSIVLKQNEIANEDLTSQHFVTLSPDKLSRLLEDVNRSMDRTGHSVEDKIIINVICRDGYQRLPLGITVAPAKDGVCKVSDIMENSLVAQQGHISAGDHLMSVNGETLNTENVKSVLNSMEKSDGEIVLVVSKSSESVPEHTVAENGTDTQIVTENREADEIDSSYIPASSVPNSAPPPLPSVDQLQTIGDISQTVVQSHEETKSPPSPLEKVPDSKPEKILENGKLSDVNMNTRPITVETKPSLPEVNGQSSDSTSVSPNSPLSPLSPLSTLSLESEDGDDDAPKETLEVTMMKGVTGLGFLIEGGKGTPKGDVPLTIRRIFKGGPAEKCGQLKVKDEILTVNGEDITHMKHSTAWNHLKFLDDGEVKLLIRRKIAQ